MLNNKEEKEKIVLIVECFEKGVGKHVFDLYNFLKDKFDIYIIYGTQRKDDWYINQIDSDKLFELNCLKRSIGCNDLISIIKIRKILKKINPKVIHCHSSKAGLAGRIATFGLKGVKRIYSPHGYMFLNYKEKSFKKNIFVFAERILSKLFTDVTVTTSVGEDKAFSENKIDKENKKIFIEHGLDDIIINQEKRKQLQENYLFGKNDIIIGSMARFEKQKDPIGTYIILNELSKKDNIKCIFWGNGSLFEQVKKMHDTDKSSVILAGQTNEADIYLSLLDIFITASLYEGLPYTLIECLGLSLPIVSSNVIGNNDCVFDNVNGKLFEAQDYNAAIQKITEIINEGKIKEYGKASLKIFKDRFSKKTMIEKYNKLYME